MDVKILVIDSEIYGMEYTLFEMTGEKTLVKGIVKNIGSSTAIHSYQIKGGKTNRLVSHIPDHSLALKAILKIMTDSEVGILKGVEEIKAVGHRVVHGAQRYQTGVLIEEKVIQDIEDYADFAPLHNPYNVAGIRAAKKLLPSIPQVAIFDTAFHQTMPPEAYLYGLPYQYYSQLGIRRYGFHGISHMYVAQRASELMGKPLKNLKLITCHLGKGCSITAIDKGKSKDTSMGFSPLEGLMMETRAGDIDPEVLIYLVMKEDLTLKGVGDLLNRHSGILGLSGQSNVREVVEKAEAGEERAKLALDVFSYRVRKYIGAYWVVLGGLDALVFTAEIGENFPYIREEICQGLESLGCKINRARNRKTIAQEREISGRESKFKVYCIPSQEELALARETKKFIKK